MPSQPSPIWDIFCRVVDNLGDIGVCWRLSCDLASRDIDVRLWVDDASALAWMAPHGCRGVAVLPWDGAASDVEPGDVVIEAFGCELPQRFIGRMAAKATRSAAPVWINLEYLSAEADVERSHRLPSPQMRGPGTGLTKFFFYPGFTPATGGLLREPDLMQRHAVFDAVAWLHGLGIEQQADEMAVSLFCYANPALPALIDALAQRPTLLLVTASLAAQQAQALLGPTLQRGALRAVLLPALPQRDYDHLLWACDLNFVRGEDSFVRAQWAGRPFVWQIYPQDDGVHRIKLNAYLERLLHGVSADEASDLRRWFDAWNGFGAVPSHLPPLAPWQARVRAWRADLLRQPDLTGQLLGFVAERR